MSYFFLTHVLHGSNDLSFQKLWELLMRAFFWKYVGGPMKHALTKMVTLKSQSMKILIREMSHKKKFKLSLDIEIFLEVRNFDT